MIKRNVCIVTGSRSDYGLLYWIIKYFNEDPEIKLNLIATGMHLSPEFGNTYKQIEEDGFAINEKIESLLSSDTAQGVAKSIGLNVINFASSFSNFKPDILVLLGDRSEIFAAAQAALIAQIPIAHIHGGETTEGSIDEAFRHSITKMSHLHFVATEAYKNRVIQLGERPENIFNFGSPGLDNIHNIDTLNNEELEDKLKLKFNKFNFLITFHPPTINCDQKIIDNSIAEILNSLEHFKNTHFFFTKSNSDVSGRIINQRIEEFVDRNNAISVVHPSLGQKTFLSLLRNIDVMIGNSSSAFIEAAALKVPSINIGIRQNGRLTSSSIIHCAEKELIYAIEKALNNDFKKSFSTGSFPYGFGENNSLKIYKKIKDFPLENILIKIFYNNLDAR